MDLNAILSTNTLDKIKSDVSSFLKKHNIDFEDPDVRKKLDEELFNIVKAFVTGYIFKKK